MGAQPPKPNKWRTKKIISSLTSRRKSLSSSSTLTTIRKLSIFSLLLTVTVLILSLPTTIKAKTTNVTDIRTLLESSKINFRTWHKNVTYSSSTRYYPRGMGPLYNSTHQVLQWFIGKQAIPEGYIIVTEGDIRTGPRVDNNEWGELAKHYWPILLVVAICALLVVLMPIIGLCFCCCRCAGACGGRSQPFDKKHDTCRRVFLGLLLICAATGLLFGVVVTFATNSYMQEGIDDISTSIRHSRSDTKTFLQTTSEEIYHLLVNNFIELSQQLRQILSDTGGIVFEDLKEKSKAVSFRHLNEFVDHLPKIEKDLKRMKHITNELRVNASQLSDGLRGVKRELLQMLSKCQTKECKDVLVNYEIGKLDSNDIDYNQLPDVNGIIQSVSDLLSTGVADVVKNGNEALNNMEHKLNDTIKKSTPKIVESIEKAGEAIKNQSKAMTNTFNSLSYNIDNSTEKALKEFDKYLDEYGIYRFYIGVAISSILLLVLCAITFALFCGICGKRPDGYGDDCCNKGSGSRFLMLAIAVIFLSISILAVAALVHFLVGLILYRGVCVPLKNPDNDQIFQYLDNYIDLNNVFNGDKKNVKNKHVFKNTGSLSAFRISHVILDCKKNHTMYEVLRLHDHFDISDIRDFPTKFNINKTLSDLVENINVDTNIVMLNEKDKEKILKIADSALKDFDPDKFVDNLNENFTKFSLRTIATQLRETADKITSLEMSEVTISLRTQALHLETYHDNLVHPMTVQSQELGRLATALDKSLRIDGLPFEKSVAKMVEEIANAQDNIKVNGSDFVRDAAQSLAAHFTLEMNKYLDFVIHAVEKNIGKCGPLANVYDSSIVAGCNKIVDPLNGFWAGVGWCVLLFLPTLIICAKLSTLYQKSDPYPGPLVESEYLYDAYSERDNIPLANGPKNKRRKHKERRRGSRDRRGDYYEESGGSSHGGAGGGDAGVRDTRYNDMAPKHWDGGPPRYTNPPMAPPSSEYERPPPYYYPGASEQE